MESINQQEEIEKRLKIIKAHYEGKPIEVLTKGLRKWEKATEKSINFDWDNKDYRVIEYQPFTDMVDACCMIGSVVVPKDFQGENGNKQIYLITAVGKDYVTIGGVNYTWKDAFDKFTVGKKMVDPEEWFLEIPFGKHNG